MPTSYTKPYQSTALYVTCCQSLGTHNSQEVFNYALIRGRFDNLSLGFERSIESLNFQHTL